MTTPTHAPGFCPRCGTRLVSQQGPDGRDACAECEFVRYADPKVAAGVVVEFNNRIVLIRRNHEPKYGEWSFPSGYVDAGEVVEDAAAREVREETGLEVRVGELLGVFSTAGDPVGFIVYAGTAIGGRMRAGPEAMSVEAFDPEQLPPLGFAHDSAIVDAWRSRRRPAG